MVLQKERLLTYGVDSPGQSRGISPLQGRGRRSEGRRGLHLQKASRGPQRGFKGASRGLEGGFTLKGASKGLERGFKGASTGLEGGLKPSALKGASRGLEGGFEGASIQGGFKGA